MLILLSVLGCYQENLPDYDFVGKVVVPKAAATRRASALAALPVVSQHGAIGRRAERDRAAHAQQGLCRC